MLLLIEIFYSSSMYCSMAVLLFQVPVGPPSEIDEIFDAISYSKGASVIRMLHEYLGDEVCHFLTEDTL